MRCLQCNKDTSSTGNFCINCGAALRDVANNEITKLQNELSEITKRNTELEKVNTELNDRLTQRQEQLSEQENDKLRNDISEKDSKLTEASKQLKKEKNSRKIWIAGGCLLICLISVVLGLVCKNLQSKLNSERRSNSSLIIEKQNLSKRINSLEKEKGKIEEEKQSLQQKLNDISTVYPLIIKSIKVGNTYSNGEVETPFGDRLYSKNSMYLEPQVEYIGLKQDTTIRLYTKLYRGKELRAGRNSPSGGYTSFRYVALSESGKAQLGRLGGNKGYWSRGSYRYEIWYDGMCLKTVHFTLY